MQELDNFRKLALLLINPDGKIISVPVNGRVLHLNYFIDLYHDDIRFKDLCDNYSIRMPDTIFDSEMTLAYDIDKELASVGIVIFHNLFIDAIISNPSYVEMAPPQFYVALPTKLTEQQESVMNYIFDNYDMSCSLYDMYIDEEMEDITYEELRHVSKQKCLK